VGIPTREQGSGDSHSCNKLAMVYSFPLFTIRNQNKFKQNLHFLMIFQFQKLHNLLLMLLSR